MSKSTAVSAAWKKHQASDAELAHVAILRAADRLDKPIRDLLTGHGLTAQQYNVLRILRGAGPDGLATLEIGRRMITRVPDVSRLVDRLVKAGLARRQRSSADRRVVQIVATNRALELLAAIDRPMAKLHRTHAGALSDRQLKTLHKLLAKLCTGQ